MSSTMSNARPGMLESCTVTPETEYAAMAKEDELAARTLFNAGWYRQAVYLTVQAIEKFIRAAIFHRVNPNTEYFRERARTHYVDELLEFLLDIVGDNDQLKHQLRSQLQDIVLGSLKLGRLQNDVRYPRYSIRDNSYSVLRVTRECAADIIQRLELLKRFLDDIEMIR